MDDLIDKSERYSNADGKDRRDVFDQEHVYTYTFNSDEPNIDAIDAVSKILEGIAQERVNAERTRVKVLTLLNDAEDPDERIKNALVKARAIDDPALKTAIKSLEKAQKQIEKSRQRMQKQQQNVLEKLKEIERLSEQG